MIGAGEVKYRIPIWEGALMIALAVIYDLIQMALVWFLGWIWIGFIGAWFMTLWGGLTFGLWFTLKGASIMSGKRAASLGLGALIEILPFVNSLPGWTVSTIIGISVTRAEDFLAHSGSPLAQMAVKGLKRAVKPIRK